MEKTRIRFTKSRIPYVTGDIAAFYPNIAERYIKEGVAEPLTVIVKAVTSFQESKPLPVEDIPVDETKPIVRKRGRPPKVEG